MLKKVLAVMVAVCSVFVVSAKPAPKVTLTGSDGSSKQFGTIQEALNSLVTAKGDFTIKLPKGTYPEVLYYKGAANITISGDSKAKYGSDVVIAMDNDGDLLRLTQGSNAEKNRCLFEFEGSGNLVLENLTLHNTFERGSIAGSNTQAEAFGFDGTGTVAAVNCSFLSHQDTIRTTGKTWFYKCYIEGDTDFLWMENSGKVALYEECEIISVFDKNASNHTSYVCAPRMDIASKAAKGIVIFNSTVTSQKDQVTFLARTPWTSGYLNQVAYVNVKTTGVNSEPWYKTPLTKEGVPQSVIGWKMDKATAASLGLKAEGRKDIISDSDLAAEFSGRKAILNRIFDSASGKYKMDADLVWDIDGLIAKKGWKVSADKSSNLLAGEKAVEKKVYKLDGWGDVKALTFNGFAQEGEKAHYVGKEGASIVVPVPGKCLITVTGYYAGSGLIQAGNQGAAVYDLNNGSTNKFNEKVYVVYEDAKEVTITASTKSYITAISVEGDDGLSFRPVESISVTADGNISELPGRKNVQMNAVLNPANATNTDFVWSVSDEKLASIDEQGILTANVLDKDSVVTVIATSRDAKAVAGKKDIKILKPEAGAFSITWLDNPKTSSSYEGTSDDPKIATAGKAKPSAAGTWSHNASKITADVAKGSISFSGYSTPIKDKDTVYVEFPITAVEKFEITELKIAYGNHGTSNVASKVTYKIGKKIKGDILEDTSRAIRSVKKAYPLEKGVVVEKGQTITIRIALYGFAGSGETAIPTGKAPTVATVVVSGKQVK